MEVVTTKILLVEEDRMANENVTELLLRYGHSVTALPRAVDAIAEIGNEEGAYDVLLSDVFLPGANGLALLKRAKERFPEMTIVVMASHTASGTMCKALELGAHAFMSKPLNLVDMVGLLKQIETHRKKIGSLRMKGEP